MKYSVSRINTKRTKALASNVCPRVRLTGRKINYKKEFGLGFGDYAEVKTNRAITNDDTERSEPCIALYPAMNLASSWVFWNIKTKKRVRRSNYKYYKTSNLVKAAMNELSGQGEVAIVPEGASESVEERPHVNDAGRMSSNIKSRERTERRKLLLANLSVKRGIREYGKMAVDSIIKEFSTLFREKKALVPVHLSKLNRKQRRKLLRSHMFLKLKRDARGNVEKMKSRLVGDGRTQEKEMYSNLRSPTADIESVFLMLELASRRKLGATKIDFLAAYLNAEIEEGDHIYMWLTRELTEILVIYFPELRPFVGKGGRLVVRILKALYGLLQSAALWFALIYGYLLKLGFTSNWVSVCVLNLSKGGRELTIILYVDDILVLWKHLRDAKVRNCW